MLIHGYGGDHSSWGPAIAPLAENFRTLAVDLPGYGKSPAAPEAVSPAAHADAILSLLEGIDGPVCLIGWSHGGATALRVALRAPDRVDCIVAISAGYAYAVPGVRDPDLAGHQPGGLADFPADTPKRAAAHLRRAFADDSVAADPGFLEATVSYARQHAETNARLIEAYRTGEDTLDGRLGDLEVPVMVVSGTFDEIAPPHLDDRLARELPNAVLLRFPHSAHVVPIEETNAFVTMTTAFANRHLR